MSTSTFSGRYITALTFAAVLVLALGWLLRPDEVPDNPAPLPSDTELQELARRAERRALDDMSDYFAGTVRDVERSVVYMADTHSSAVAWGDDVLVGAPRPSTPDAAPTPVYSGPRIGTAAPRFWGSPLLLSLFSAPVGVPFDNARRAAASPASGTWVVAVWRTGSQSAYAVGTSVHTMPADCDGTTVETLVVSQPLTPAMAGGGLFDLEGRLLGVVLPCADRMAAVTADAVERIRTSLQATDENADLAMRYGLGLSPLDENEARYFGRAEGLLVREVWDGSFAARAGVAPGDVVVAIGDRPIDSAGAFLSAAPESAPITIRRGRTTMRLPIAPQAGALGLQLTPGTSLRVDRVFEGSTAAAAGLQEGDRLLRVDSAAADDEAATRRRLARVDAPHWLEVQRGRRRIGMLLRPEARR